MKNMVLLFLISWLPLMAERPVDLVIFSYDRPMQLYALLESCEQNIAGINEMHLIYRTSNANFDAGYEKVFQRFQGLIRHHQSDNPKQDFKPLVLKSVFSKNSRAPYVMFAVDDIIVSGPVDLQYCVDALKVSKAYAFFLRLGKNITSCYMRNKSTPVPRGKEFQHNFFVWKFVF